MRYEVSGTTMQTVGIDLSPGEMIYSQTATMAWMTDGVRMNTHTGGGLFACPAGVREGEFIGERLFRPPA